MRLTLRHHSLETDIEVPDLQAARLQLGALRHVAAGATAAIDPIDPIDAPDAPDAPGRSGGAVVVDGTRHPATATLLAAGVTAGSVLEVDADLPPAARSCAGGPAPPIVRLAVIGGLDAGATFDLGPGAHAVGRAAENDVCLTSPTVSRHHAVIHVGAEVGSTTTVEDLASTNGLRRDDAFVARHTTAPVGEDDPLVLGATHLALRPPLPADPRTPPASPPGGRPGPQPFNRPPRLLVAPAPAAIAVPAEPRRLGGRTPFSWAMFLAPLFIGLVMAAVVSPAFAVFALLSPVVMVASWFEQRRRTRRDRRRDSRAHRSAMARFELALDAAAAQERQRLEHRHPDLAVIADRLHRADPCLWERRPWHDDFLELRVGQGPRPWSPPLASVGSGPRPDAVEAALAARATLDAPIVVALRAGAVVGIVGAVDAARAVARSLVIQAAAAQGPADLRVAVVAAPANQAPWAFATWLPHTVDPDGALPTLVARGSGAARVVALAVQGFAAHPARHEVRVGPPSLGVPPRAQVTPVTLSVLDAFGSPPEGAITRLVLPEPGPEPDCRAAIVLTDRLDDLPASCTTVIRCCGEHGLGQVTHPAGGPPTTDVLLMGLGPAMSTSLARRLARHTDPDHEPRRGAAPAAVTLADVLDRAGTLPEDLAPAWRSARPGGSLVASIGAHGHGIATLDLVRDGPHMLVGGTTGAGKSELLRSFVATLAASRSPDDVTFVLIDYKGGSAFDACARLPHVVGLVTDLDDDLARRALVSLEAEIRYRERRLREAGADDLAAYVSDPARIATSPLPRLVVVIDELATLAGELPTFLDSLIAIAQRGRSLGIHLVLATQRPHGVISENIRTNTNIRVALRMLDDADSVDVIGRPDAARLPRARPGRALVRLGPDELTEIQVAHATAPAPPPPRPPTSRTATPEAAGATSTEGTICVVDAFGAPVDSGDRGRRAGPDPADGRHPPEPGPTMLDQLVDTIAATWARHDRPVPRRPWLDPLPASLPLSSLPRPPADGPRLDAGGAPGAVRLAPVALGLVDEPWDQHQRPWCWDPTAGSLLVYGMPGSGVTTALLTAAHALAARHDPDDLHLYGLDFGAGTLTDLVSLDHVGAVVTLPEVARQHRLLRQLRADLDERRRTPDRPWPAIVVLIDDIAALRAAHDDLDGLPFVDGVVRLAVDGPPFGVHVAVTASRPQAMPVNLAGNSAQRILLRMPEAFDYAMCGLQRRAPDTAPPGRGHLLNGAEIQLACHRPGPQEPGPVGGRGGGRRPPPTIDVLPDQVGLASLPTPIADLRRVTLPFALGDLDLGPRSLCLGPGDHALVTGPSASGRTTCLATLAVAAARAGLHVVAVAPQGGHELASAIEHAGVEATVVAWSARAGDADAGAGAGAGAEALRRWTDRDPAAPRALVLVDDADRVADHDDILRGLVLDTAGRVHVVAAGRPERLRTNHGHWTRPLRDADQGLALRPDITSDGDLWNVRFRRPPGATWPAGRALLLARGDTELVQVARA